MSNFLLFHRGSIKPYIKLFISIIIGVSSWSVAYSKILFVSQQFGADGNDGNSWGQAYNSLKFALDLAQYGDEVWIGEGVYLTSESNSRAERFVLKNGVKLFGGFVGTENSVLDRISIATHETVLDGNINDPNLDSDNALIVLEVIGSDQNTIIDGISIRNGNSLYNTDTLTCLHGAGLVFTANSSKNGRIAVRNCNFSYNSSCNDGGALYVSPLGYYEKISIINCNFYKNSANRAAAIDINGLNQLDSIELFNCTFNNNLNKFGVGVRIVNSQVSYANIVNTTFTNSFLQVQSKLILFDSCHVTADDYTDITKDNFGYLSYNASLSLENNVFDISSDILLRNSVFDFKKYQVSLELFSAESTNSKIKLINNSFFFDQRNVIAGGASQFLKFSGYTSLQNCVFQNIDPYSYYSYAKGFGNFIECNVNIEVVNSLFVNLFGLGGRVIKGKEVKIFNSIFDNVFSRHLYVTRDPWMSIFDHDFAYDKTKLAFGDILDSNSTLLLKSSCLDIGSPDDLSYLAVTGGLSNAKLVKFDKIFESNNSYLSQPTYQFNSIGQITGILSCSLIKDKGSDSIVVNNGIKIDRNGAMRIEGNHVDIGPFELSENCSLTSASDNKGDISSVRLQAFPNPVKAGSRLTLNLSSQLKQKVEVNIYNLAGSLLSEGIFDLSVNNQDIQFKVPDTPGVYFIRISLPRDHIERNIKLLVMP